MGFDTSDDACVYKITDDVAAIHTVDFFTPIVDDPYQFGQIAAANALSHGRTAGGGNELIMCSQLSFQGNDPADLKGRP